MDGIIQADQKSLHQVLIITGLSGAGKKSVMQSLEDQGFYCVDNLPIPLLSTFLDFIFKTNKGSRVVRVALGIDVRGGKFLKDFMHELEAIKSNSNETFVVKVIFLSAQDQTIMKRFQETRRAHPLAEGISIAAAIKKERELLRPIEDIADEIHHTDTSTIHELRRWVWDCFGGGSLQKLSVNVISFGFKYGVPPESNLVYDLRFLPNPYFIPELKALDGRNKLVQEFLFSKGDVLVYWEKLQDFLQYVLKCYHEEGRFFANVSIGCTGGKHRSVSFVEKLCEQKWENIIFLPSHRDLGKE